MKAKILKTEQEYDKTCERIYQLIHSSEKTIPIGSKQGEELEILSLIVEKYEQEHYPVDAPNPIEAIKFRMEQMDLKQKDIAPLFGGDTRVSEIMNGKRQLTLKMIILLNKYLGIPWESLMKRNENITLSPTNHSMLLNNKAIKSQFSKP